METLKREKRNFEAKQRRYEEGHVDKELIAKMEELIDLGIQKRLFPEKH